MASSFGKMPEPALGRAEPGPWDLGAALDLAVQPLDGVGAVRLGPVCRRQAHRGEDVGFGLVHKLGEFSDLGPDVVGDLPPGPRLVSWRRTSVQNVSASDSADRQAQHFAPAV